MHWILLAIAGLFECGWAVAAKLSDGFSKPVPVALAAISMALSVLLLAIATRSIPIGTAYAAWTGIGTLGVASLGVWLFDEPITPARILCIAAIAAGVVGLHALDR